MPEKLYDPQSLIHLLSGPLQTKFSVFWYRSWNKEKSHNGRRTCLQSLLDWGLGGTVLGRTLMSKFMCILPHHQYEPLFCTLLPPNERWWHHFLLLKQKRRKRCQNAYVYRKIRHVTSGNSPTFAWEILSRTMNLGILNIFWCSVQNRRISVRKANWLINSTSSPALTSSPNFKSTTNF